MINARLRRMNRAWVREHLGPDGYTDDKGTDDRRCLPQPVPTKFGDRETCGGDFSLILKTQTSTERRASSGCLKRPGGLT
jgi:hypothetical protein